MMPGMIMLWYGSIASIPSGWTICDGTMGTPDLQDRFVMGVGAAHPPGTRGGTVVHSHIFTGDGHAHDLVAGNVIADVAPAGDFKHNTNVVPATGTTNTYTTYPSYEALCYIMKL